MDLRLLIVLGALFGLIYSFKVNNKFAKILNWVMVVAIGVSLIPVAEVAIDGYYLFAITQVGLLIYTFSYVDFTPLKKLVLATIAIFSCLPLILVLYQVSFPIDIRLLSFGVLILYIYILVKHVKLFKEEMGMLTILAVVAIDVCIRFFLTNH